MSAAAALADALAAIEQVDGWLTDAQAARLWAAAAASTGPIVEIGSFRGRSTIVLACAAPAGTLLTAIDPHLGGDRGPQQLADAPALGESDHSAFHANLERAGVARRVTHVRERSAAAHPRVEGEVALLYVDGAHRIRPASADLRDWGGRVAPGGRLLVHDAFSSIGVTVALFAHVVGRDGWTYAGRSGSLAEYVRGPRLDERGRRAELRRGLAQLPWFARNLVVKALIVARASWAARLLGHRSGPWPY